jgi:hypothetical protein
MTEEQLSADASTNCTPHQSITVTLPDGHNIESAGTTQLQIPIIPQSATTGYLFPELREHSLLSIGMLCDAGCTAVFHRSHCDVIYDNQTILSGI